MKIYYVYILTNKYRTVFYIGVTNNLVKRIESHKEGMGSIFTQKYNLKSLIYFEEFTSISQAILREKQLKNWKREWKINLIKSKNLNLKDINIL
ncbi:GIY-YIG nuclease family protein [Empedobacter sedimenti]|uniref:GIY-YIG nuclease family protein n=1 Tax=Empedobacter sedimenti TaxID=3042610 RepID=UPI0024A71E58|nr:GIY-YIG nuclease family protein [Empedobacter sedimenti]